MADYYQLGPQGSGAGRWVQLPDAAGKPVVTWTLLAVNGLVWLAMQVAGGSKDPEILLDFGAMFGPFIANGEYWRLLTAMFLHVGFVHLLFNGIGLFIFGRLVERVYGHFRFGIIYATAGLAGSVASYLINPTAIAAGASGAIFGVLGALAAFFLARRDVLGELGRQNLSGILIVAVISLLYGFITPGIDNWAHMGGLVAGFGIGFAFVPEYRTVQNPFGFAYSAWAASPSARALWVLPLAALVLVAGAGLGTVALPDTPLSHVLKAEGQLEQGSYDEALVEIEHALQLDPSIGTAYYLRARIMAAFGNAQQAREDLGIAIQRGLDRETAAAALALLVELSLRR